MKVSAERKRRKGIKIEGIAYLLFERCAGGECAYIYIYTIEREPNSPLISSASDLESIDKSRFREGGSTELPTRPSTLFPFYFLKALYIHV